MKQLLEQSGYVCETQADVWMRPGFASIAYSDGDEVEQRLAKIIGEASDLSVLSDELKSHISDWPSLYHLSGTRANLLRPFEQRLTGAQVLEIGAGCGAITRYLAESGAHVLALEGSARRAAIARSRTRDLGNVAVLAERFDDFAADAQFDVVTLIGVLEYANQFVAGDVPALTMLKRARALLKPDGVLLIAIENQLGLKYWAGAPEDHLGVPMYGIEERYRKDQPQTYGRAKLGSLLAEAGFPRSDFYSPLPDYKLPVSVLTPSGLSSSDFDAAAFASQSARRDPQLPAAPSFALELAWPAIMRNRLGADLANSFLIAASNDEVLEMDGAVLAYHYSTERKRRFCKQTVFRRGVHGAIGVHCELLSPPTAQAQGPLLAFQLPAPIPYTLGHTLASDLVKMVSTDGWTVDALGAQLRRFLDIIGPIVFDGQRMPELGSAQQRLPGICFDLVPQNIVRDAEGRFHAIDLEWKLEHGMPVGWLLFRTLLLLVQGVTWFGRPGQPFVTTRRGFFLGAFRAAGFEIDAQELESFAALETAAQVEVTGRQVLAVANWWGDSPLPMRSATTPTGDALRALEVRVQQADASLEMTQSKLDEQTARAEQAERAALLLSERKEQEIQALEVRLREADEAAERMGRQVELLDRGMSEQTDRAVQVEHALLQSERRAAELQEQSEQSGRRAAELLEQSQHSVEARDALQRDLEQFHQASRDQMAHRDWHIAALQGSLQDIRNSTSWRITGPMRAISRTVTKMHTGTQLVPDAIRLGGGVLPTLRRTARVLRREGVDGVRLRLANIQAKARGAVPVGLLEGPERAPAVQQLVPWYPNPLWDAEPAMVPEWVTRFAVHCHLDTPADATACLAWLQAIAIPFDLFISIAGGQGGSALQRRFKRGLVHAGAVQVTDASTAARPLTALLTHFGPAMATYPAVMHVHFSDADGVRAARSLLGPEGASGGRLTQLLGMLQQAAALVLAADTKPAMRQQARAANAEWVTRVAQACKLRLDAAPAAWPLLGGSAFLARGACLQDALAAVSLLQDDGGGAVREAFVSDALAAMLPVFAAAQNAKALRIQEGDSIDDLREYEAPRDYSADIVHRDVKVLSYYLPQFHPTPENDEWHGKGFTEWTKVRGANPLFAGHYQQHIPHPDIGYYLLGSPAVLRLQAEQMRQAGVHGQVFYHYWFGGRMILEKPAQMLLAHPDIAMPYCFCWANENWTRRWDGNEREILLGQSYSAEDARAFIQYLIPFFRDSRYIRVGERPMLMVYRPSSIPDAAQYVDVWAEECAKAGIAAPYVVAVLTRGATNPADFRMDAGVERVLHDWTDGAVPDLRPSLKPYWPMNGSALSYDLVRDFYMGQNDRKPFDYFRSNVPMWDNTARYGTEALLLHGSTPQSFQQWMEHSIADAQSNLPADRRFVVVNAWNEWAEGTHLEPDTRYGYSYLNCIGRALSGLGYAHELNAGAALPAEVRVHVHFTPELMQRLDADAQLRKRFLRCIGRSRILREQGVLASPLPFGVELMLRDEPLAAGPSDLHLEFRRPVYFAQDAVENMLRTAWATRAVVVGNDYGAQLVAQNVLENGGVDSGIAHQSSVVVRPQHIGEVFDAPVRMRTDAWCFALPASPAAGADLPVVTTIVRFHRNARLDELRSAVSCLYVMQDCIVVPLIAAQDLDAAQTAALHQMLAEFDWAPGFEPRVEHHASADGRGDLRSRMLNKSLQQVTTRYAAFLDYDDLLLPDAYAWLVHRLRTTGKAIAFGRVYWTGALSRMSILTTRRKAFEYGASHAEFVSNNHAPLHSIVLDVQQLDLKNLVYFEDQRYMEDYLMTLQLFRADNGDWEGLSLNHYVGDYVHSMDRQHTLALNDDAVRAALLSDPEYMLCEKRIVDMRNRVTVA